MKFLLVVLAAVALANGKAVHQNRGLDQDLQDFVDLIDMDKVAAIALDHLANDPELQEVINYLQSDDFKTIIKAVDAIPEYIEFLTYLQHSGLDIYKYVNQIHELLGLDPLPVPPSKVARSTRSLNGLLDEILAVLPREQLRALFEEKLQTSPEFANLIERIRGPEFQGIVQKLVSIPEYQELKQRLREKGVDVDHYIDYIKALLGITRHVKVGHPTRNLDQDFQDFVDLIDKEKVLAIVLDHLANDPEIQEVIDYLNSDDFKTIVSAVDAIPEYIEFLTYLQHSGLDVYTYVNLIHDLVGLDPLPVPPSKAARSPRSLNGLLDEILAVLPREQLRTLFEEKLQTSPEFANLIERIRGPEFQGIVQKLASIPEYQELKQKLREKGVDVDHIIDYLKALLGITRQGKVGYQTRNLDQDLQDFLALIDKEKVLTIVFDHLANDPELQDVITYLQSDDFKIIVTTVDAIPEYIEFLTYLQHSGLDVFSFLNRIHELLDLPLLPVPPSKATRSLNGMLDEVLAVLPREQLHALFEEKLQTSPEFANLIERIQGPEFQVIVQKLVAIPEYQELKQKLREKGVDVDHIIDFIKNLLSIPSRM